MWLTEVSIRRRVFIGMVVAALIVLGARGLMDMPWDLYPSIEFPIVSVSVVYPGAGPEELEDSVAEPLEEAVSIINGVDTVESICQENFLNTVIRFRYGTDVDVAAADVRDAVERARAQFPEEAKPPTLYKLDIRAMPVMELGVASTREATEFKRIVEDRIKNPLNKLPGVASVTMTGELEREIHVEVDRERLDAVGLSISQLAQLLKAENVDIPGGNIKEGRLDYSIRALGKFKRVSEISRLKIPTPLGGLVRVGELATVRDTTAERESIARLNGKPCITLSITKQAQANTVRVANAVKKELKTIRHNLPADTDVAIYWDASERILEALKDVFFALIWGALLASFVVFLFLHNLRGTVIVALAIPTSIMAAFLPVSLAGLTLNMMVMLALSLSVGILVDDSIVVLENIERHLQMGEEPAAAALNGRSEIGLAAIAITSVDVVVFLPIAFMGGMVGQFFRAFGITAAITTAFSLFMSFTLTPMLASWWYPRIDVHRDLAGRQTFSRRLFAQFDRAYGWLERKYRGLLRRAVHHRFLTIFLGVAGLAVAAVGIMPRLGSELMPSTDEGQVSIQVEMPAGTRLEETDRVCRQIEQVLADRSRYPEIRDYAFQVGTAGGGIVSAGGRGGQYAQATVVLVKKRQRKRSDVDIVAELRKDLKGIPSATIKVVVASSMGGGRAEAPIEYELRGADLTVLEDTALKMVRRLEQEPGFVYPERSTKAGRPELHVVVDRDRAADLGLTAGQVAMAVRASVEGDTSTQFSEGGKEYDIRIQLTKQQRNNVRDVKAIFLGMTRSGQPLRVRDVADVVESSGPTKIEREDQQRKVTVTSYLEKGFDLGAAQQKVLEIAQGIVPETVSTSWGGQVKYMGESFRFLGQSLILAIILVYLVTAALYNAVLEPLNVWFTVPMAMVGAALALLIGGFTVSIVSLIGIVMLMGLVGKNAILLVDYTNTLRARGLDRTEAILRAGPTRMKPILMTATATIFGMLPTAIALAEGSEWRAPMGYTVIGGLLLSTLLTLLIVPSMYTVIDDIATFFTRAYYRIFLKREPDPRRRWRHM